MNLIKFKTRQVRVKTIRNCLLAASLRIKQQWRRERTRGWMPSYITWTSVCSRMHASWIIGLHRMQQPVFWRQWILWITQKFAKSLISILVNLWRMIWAGSILNSHLPWARSSLHPRSMRMTGIFIKHTVTKSDSPKMTLSQFSWAERSKSRIWK